jgi:hypothetical protein
MVARRFSETKRGGAEIVSVATQSLDTWRLGVSFCDGGHCRSHPPNRYINKRWGDRNEY